MRRNLINAINAARLRACSVRSLKRYAVDPDDDFPKPIMDAGHLKWDEREIDAWIERKFAERDKQWREIRALIRGEKRR
jgi:predicted DNA-binding transcriptional regulator AlpA